MSICVRFGKAHLGLEVQSPGCETGGSSNFPDVMPVDVRWVLNDYISSCSKHRGYDSITERFRSLQEPFLCYRVH